MATVSLPYPNLVFAPLDKLTAEEMNQIVANYTAIANAFPLNADQIATGAITSAKLANGSVGMDAINWSAFPMKITFDNVGFALSTNWQVVTSINVSDFPTGSHMLVFGQSQFSNDGEETGVDMQLAYGGFTSNVYNDVFKWSTSNTVSWIFEKTATVSTINLQNKKNSNASASNVRSGWRHMYAVRIA